MHSKQRPSFIINVQSKNVVLLLPWHSIFYMKPLKTSFPFRSKRKPQFVINHWKEEIMKNSNIKKHIQGVIWKKKLTWFPVKPDVEGHRLFINFEEFQTHIPSSKFQICKCPDNEDILLEQENWDTRYNIYDSVNKFNFFSDFNAQK